MLEQPYRDGVFTRHRLANLLSRLLARRLCAQEGRLQLLNGTELIGRPTRSTTTSKGAL